MMRNGENTYQDLRFRGSSSTNAHLARLHTQVVDSVTGALLWQVESGPKFNIPSSEGGNCSV